MEIFGLPLHPLVVHAAVVLTPLACLVTLGYLFVPRWAELLRWPAAVVAIIALACVWAAYLTGQNFFDSDRFSSVQGELRADIERHEDLAGILRWVTTGYAVAAVAFAFQLHGKPGAARVVVGLLVAAAAVATLVLVVLTGDAGSRAVWG